MIWCKPGVVALSLMTVTVIAACGSSSNNGASGPILVGITGPFTGAYADPGTAIRNASWRERGTATGQRPRTSTTAMLERYGRYGPR